MTSHELAAILLSGPDETVAFWMYTGGNDERSEVISAVLEDDEYEGRAVVLYTYAKENILQTHS